jgi:N12 class adenine-specific DNA methylase
MDYSFIDDSGWNDLDDETKSKVIDLSFQDQIVSDPEWLSLPEQTKADVKKIYSSDANEYSRSKAIKKYNVFGGIKDVGQLLYDVPVNTIGAYASLWEDDNPEENYDWKDISRKAQEERTKQRAVEEGGEEYVLPFIQRKDIREAGASTGFSAVAMGAAAAGGAASGLIPIPGARVAGALAGSGTAAYKMDKAAFTQQLIDAFRQTKKGKTTPEEINQLVINTRDLRNKHALWEAIPESIGNVAQLSGIGALFNAALGKKLGAKLFKTVAGMYGAELSTETITQMGQHNVEVAAGLSQDDDRSFLSGSDIYDSFKEVAPQTFILTSLMGGGGVVAGKVASIGKAKTVDEAVDSFEKSIDISPAGSIVEKEDVPRGILSQEQEKIDPIDDTINKFEADLEQAQKDIKSYPLPDIKPEITPDAKEIIARQKEQAYIKKAVDTGQFVPADVLKQYPDIIKQEDITETPGAKKAILKDDEKALAEVNTEPTEAQKVAENYKKAHIKVNGFNLSIENPAGSTRSGVDESGKAWSQKMNSHYGYFKRTMGKDGDQVDAFINPDGKEGTQFYIVNQIDSKTKKFDEHKVMVGYESEEDAKAAYLSNYEDGWQGLGNIVEMGQDDFKEWVKDGKRTKKPAEELIKIVKTQEKAEEFKPGQLISFNTKKGVAQGTIISKRGSMLHVQKEDGKKTLVNPKTNELKIVESKPDISEELNKEIPGHNFKYDGEGDAGHSITPQSGEFKGRSLTVKDLTVKAVKDKMAEQFKATSGPIVKKEDAPRGKQSKKEIGDAIDKFFGGGQSKNKDKAINKRIAEIKDMIKGTGKVTNEDKKFIKDANDRISELKGMLLEPKEQEVSHEDYDQLRYLGKNTDGKSLYDDVAGVRSIEEAPSILSAQPVGIIPGKGSTFSSPRKLWNEGKHEYLTDKEISKYESEKVKVKEEIKKGPDKKVYGSKNKVFTQDAADKARDLLKKKFSGKTLYSGLDPEIMQAGIQLAGYHIEAGARSFIDYSKAMVTDIGDSIKPFLRAFYEGVRYYPGIDAEGMTDPKEIDKLITEDYNIEKQEVSDVETKPIKKDETEPVKDREPKPGQGLGKPSDLADGQQTGLAEVYIPGEKETTIQQPPVSDTKSPSIKGDKEGGSKTTSGPDRGDSVKPDSIAPGTVGSEGAGTTTGKPDVTDIGMEPKPARNHVIEKSDILFPKGPETKINANIKAIRLLKKLENSKKHPTKAEKKTLAQYVGWGAFSQKVFNKKFSKYHDKNSTYTPQYLYGAELEKYEEWKNKYGKKLHPGLKGLMTEEEWKSAAASTLNAHYTSKEVVEKVWDLVERLGFKGGNVLEPSAGVGHFFGLMPFQNKSMLHGVELDKITGRILKQLYPEGNMQVSGFEKAKGLAKNSMDVVISNFPFGSFSVLDKGYKEYSKWSIHNYFFGKSLDLVKPGGLVVGITSHFTMDAVSNGNIRKALSEKGDLVGAIRLPYTAFKKDAGTEVVTDIIVFRKKDGTEQLGNRFRTSEEIKLRGGTANINEYFVNNPDNILGQNSLSGSMYGSDEYTVTPTMGANLTDQISKAIEAFPQDIIGEGQATPLEKSVFAEEGEKEGVLYNKNGKLYVISDGKSVEPTLIDSKGKEVPALNSSARKLKAISYLKLRDATKNLILMMQDPNQSDSDISTLMGKTKKLYENFISKNDYLNHVSNSFLRKIDNDFPIVDALENETVIQKEDGKEIKAYSPADILTKRTIYPFKEPETADSIQDAIPISLVYKNKIDVQYISSLTGITEEDVKKEIIEKERAYIDPGTGMLETPDKYLSGNVKKKLIIAKEQFKLNPEYERNVKALEAAQPDDIDLDFIFFKLGSSWLPGEAVSEFVSDLIDIKANVSQIRTDESNTWIVKVPRFSSNSKNTDTWGVDGATAIQLIKDSLNLRRTKVYKMVYIPGSDQSKKVIDKEQSLVAQKKQDVIQDEFRKWARKSKHWAPKMSEIYNREHNGFVARKFYPPDIEHFPGANTDITLRPLQKKAVARGLQESVLLSYGVGTGKTFTYVTLAMEMRRLGTARKPMIVVQGSTVRQFSSAFKTLYPQSKVLIPNDLQRTAKNRKKLLSQIATGDWDAVVIPHSFFDRIADNPEREAALIQEQIEELENAMAAAAEEEGASSPTVKQMEAAKKKKLKRLESLQDRSTDDTLTFEEMGIDALLIDEAHNYKRSEFSTKMGNIKGIDAGASKRSSSLILKSNYIREKTNNKNIILATGTPISNTTAELWTMIRYVRPELLKEYGVSLFDDFASTFGDTSITTEETSTGDFKEVERFNKFANGPELITLFHSASDVVLTKNAGLNLPEVKGGKAEVVVVERSKELGDYIEELRAEMHRFENMTGREKMANRHIPLVVFGKAKKAAIDMQMIDPVKYKDDPNGKLNTVANNIFKIWKQTTKTKGTQAVFIDAYQDTSGNFNAYRFIKEKLIEQGIPKREILIINDAGNDSKKESMFSKMRSGEARVILGSTQKLGVGVNMQDKLYAAHHVDVPLRPMDIEQRNGRIVREGNENEEVQIFNYGVKNTLDSVSYDRLIKKQKFIDQMLNGDIEGREFDDPLGSEQISFAEMNAAFSGNPLLFEKSDVIIKVKEQEILYNAHVKSVSSAKREIRGMDHQIEELTGDLKEETAKANTVKNDFPEGEPYKITYLGKEFSKKDFVKELNKLFADQETKIKSLFTGKSIKEYNDLVENEKDQYEIKAVINGYDVSIETFLSGIKARDFLDGKLYLPEDNIIVSTSLTKDGNKFLSFNGIGFTRGMNNALGNIEDAPVKTQAAIKDLKKNRLTLKDVAGKPFDDTKLKEYRNRLVEINKELEAAVPDTPPPDIVLTNTPMKREVKLPSFIKMEMGPSGNQEPVKVRGAKLFKIEEYPNVEFFIAKKKGDWVITELRTGLAAGRGKTQADAKKAFITAAEINYSNEADFIEMLNKNKIEDKKFSTTSDLNQTPGQGISLKNIQSKFKNQEVFISPDSSISIRLKNGKGIRIISTNQISGSDTQYAIETGRMGKNGLILGKAEGNTITLNKDYADDFTLTHEIKHVLDNLGILTPSDNKSIMERLNIFKRKGTLRFKLSTSKDESLARDEDLANAFAQFMQDREQYRDTVLGKILQKVVDFLDGIVYIGRQSARKLAKSFESGDIFSREPGQAQDSEIKYHKLPGYSPKNPDIRYQTSEDIIEPETEGIISKFKEIVFPKDKTITRGLAGIDSVYDAKENKWFAEKDFELHKNDVEAINLQDDLLKTMGEKRYTQKVKDMDSAIHIYLDIKRNPDHVEKYYKHLSPSDKKIVDLAQTIDLIPEVKEIADRIAKAYEELGERSKQEGVISDTIENYVNRAWKFDNKASTQVFNKFITKSRHSKQRVFETILEGMAEAGMELQLKGAINNLKAVKDEISKVIEDKKLLKELQITEHLDTGEMIFTDKTSLEGYKKLEGYHFTVFKPYGNVKGGRTKDTFINEKGKEIKLGKNAMVQTRYAAENVETGRAYKLFDTRVEAVAWIKDNKKGVLNERTTLWERRPLYAPDAIADRLNKITGRSVLSGKFKIKGVSVIDTMTKYNALAKATLLMTGLFHHQAFFRSYLFGTRNKTKSEWRPIKAYREGMQAIKDLSPEIELGVRNGLTIGLMQDWQEDILNTTDTIFGRTMDKFKVSKAIKEKINDLRMRQAKFLFGSLGAGLKAKAFIIEYRNAMNEHPELEENERARMVAALINADFGGLHLGRMGRDPTLQHIFRLVALAPDWCCDLKTRAMTKTGWKYHHELSIGDEIMAFDPKTKKLKWSDMKDQYVNEIYNGKMIFV